jgi:GNAT superfamily N-acetyltransferase
MRINQILSLFILLSCASVAMEKPATQQETYTYNHLPFTTGDKESIIQAVDSKGKAVGNIYYKPHENHENCDGTLKCKDYEYCWEITFFEVDATYRKKKIGTALFKQCIDAVRKQNGKTLIWDVNPPFGEVTIPVYDIIHIYQHITKNLGLPKAQVIDEPEHEQPLNTFWATMMVPLEKK